VIKPCGEYDCGRAWIKCTAGDWASESQCMASPSPSKTPSRAVTPGPHSPSRLVVAPSLRPTHSLSNLHVHMSSLSPGGPTTSHTGEESSASSIINVDTSEGILVPEADAEVGLVDEAGNAYVTASTPAGDEASKKALRDHLRWTLNKKDSYTGACYSWPENTS
jgi:vacuolar fusion protein MON1